MISTYQIKPAFQKLLKPVLYKLHEVGVTPNALTLLAVFLSVTMGLILYHNPSPVMRLIVAFFFLFRMALNALDGMMATTYSMQSKLGEVLNELGDVISDGALYLSLLAFTTKIELVFAFVVLMVINEYTGILAKVISGKRRYDGPMGKSDRALVIGVMLFVSFWWNPVFEYLDYVLLMSSALMILSSFLRIKRCFNK
mgnify:CR=1 FL=1